MQCRRPGLGRTPEEGNGYLLQYFYLEISWTEDSRGRRESDVTERLSLSGVSCSVVSDSSRPHGLWPTRLLYPWDFPSKNPGVRCQFLFQGIFLTQGSSPGFVNCRWILYRLNHQGSPSKRVFIRTPISWTWLTLVVSACRKLSWNLTRDPHSKSGCHHGPQQYRDTPVRLAIPSV